jgi:hypothetical protein
MLHLLDPGNFKKHIELTYAAVTASKNEYTSDCIFSRPSCGCPAGWLLLSFLAEFSTPEPVAYARDNPPML